MNARQQPGYVPLTKYDDTPETRKERLKMPFGSYLNERKPLLIAAGHRLVDAPNMLTPGTRGVGVTFLLEGETTLHDIVDALTEHHVRLPDGTLLGYALPPPVLSQRQEADGGFFRRGSVVKFSPEVQYERGQTVLSGTIITDQKLLATFARQVRQYRP